MAYKDRLVREPKMTEGCKMHLPVAYPRTDLASWISAYPQRFWITGRLCLLYHISPRVHGLVDTSPGRLYSTCLPTQRSGYSEEAPCRLTLCTPGSPVTLRSAHVSPRLASAISFFHIPSDLVVDQWASDGESSSHRDFLFLQEV